MTHDELLAKIQFSREDFNYVTPHNALQAVVELHEPIDSIRGIVCRHCFTDALNGNESYPCLTIQIIEKELQ